MLPQTLLAFMVGLAWGGVFVAPSKDRSVVDLHPVSKSLSREEVRKEVPGGNRFGLAPDGEEQRSVPNASEPAERLCSKEWIWQIMRNGKVPGAIVEELRTRCSLLEGKLAFDGLISNDPVPYRSYHLRYHPTDIKIPDLNLSLCDEWIKQLRQEYPASIDDTKATILKEYCSHIERFFVQERLNRAKRELDKKVA